MTPDTPVPVARPENEPFICQECGAELPSPATYHTIEDCRRILDEEANR